MSISITRFHAALDNLKAINKQWGSKIAAGKNFPKKSEILEKVNRELRYVALYAAQSIGIPIELTQKPFTDLEIKSKYNCNDYHYYVASLRWNGIFSIEQVEIPKHPELKFLDDSEYIELTDDLLAALVG